MTPDALPLWETEPERRTALATVTTTRRGWFQVDRALFRPSSKLYRHVQRGDAGSIKPQGGNKTQLHRISVRDDGVWYAFDGPPPKVGDRLQCELDRDRRDLDSRAHTAMHLLLGAIAADPQAPRLADDPMVRGGGRVRIDLDATWLEPARLAGWLATANEVVKADHPIERIYVPREHATQFLTPQGFPEEPFPGPDVLAAVKIDSTALPCDGTHAPRTKNVGRIMIRQARPNRNRFVIIAEVARHRRSRN